MKKLLFILICLLSTKVFAEDFDLKCKNIKGFGLSVVYRCENDEAVCYITSSNSAITCKFKK
jgi:hypothetical protein